MLRSAFENKKAFETVQGRGVGENVIKSFLGPNWTTRRIRTALAIIREDETEETFDRQAAEELDTVAQADTFRKEVKRYNIPKKEQKPLAKELKEKGWDEIKDCGGMTTVFSSEHAFNQAKGKKDGVGRRTIISFLVLQSPWL